MGSPASKPAAFGTILAACLATAGCDRSVDAAGVGFSDGFASGYGEACVMRAPTAARRWSSPAYVRGYADGMETGQAACRGDRVREGVVVTDGMHAVAQAASTSR